MSAIFNINGKEHKVSCVRYVFSGDPMVTGECDYSHDVMSEKKSPSVTMNQFIDEVKGLIDTWVKEDRDMTNEASDDYDPKLDYVRYVLRIDDEEVYDAGFTA